MSHPVFLSSSSFDHMPNGKLNEWQQFYRPDSYELDANGFIPVLWFMLFQQENLKWAKYSEDFDIAHVDNDLDPQEVQVAIEDTNSTEDVEPQNNDICENNEPQYAYLVVAQQQALQNLERHKSLFLYIFGTEYETDFLHFKLLIEKYYPEYILLRTNGLPNDFNNADFLIYPLEDIEILQTNPLQRNGYLSSLRKEFIANRFNSYYLYGEEMNQPIDELTPSNHSTLQPEAIELQATQGTGWTISVCTALVAAITIAVWFTTHSILYSSLIFFISAFVLGFISSKIK